MREFKPYNPLDKENLGKSVADALLKSSLLKMRELEPFTGAGVYALYYFGSFEAYKDIPREKEVPIYVGKAVPEGSRKGKYTFDKEVGPRLYNRLQEHVKTIENASGTLDIHDFCCRYLVVEDIWIPLGESLLISRFSPIWNQLVTGFGNHTPGSGRFKQERSLWDTLHPGRYWAMKCPPNKVSPEHIVQWVKGHIMNLYLV